MACRWSGNGSCFRARIRSCCRRRRRCWTSSAPRELNSCRAPMAGFASPVPRFAPGGDGAECPSRPALDQDAHGWRLACQAVARSDRARLRPPGFGGAAFSLAREGWWGKKDSNLRSRKTADLQSAPFATRDTPPLNSIGTHPPKWRQRGHTMTLKPGADGELPVGAFMGESARQSQPRRPLIPGRHGLKLPLFGTRDTSLL